MTERVAAIALSLCGYIVVKYYGGGNTRHIMWSAAIKIE